MQGGGEEGGEVVVMGEAEVGQGAGGEGEELSGGGWSHRLELRLDTVLGKRRIM